jgi:hypothetical protein
VGSNITCPKCRTEIPLTDVNVSTDIALCRRCGQTWSYSELVDESKFSKFDPQTTPSGAWLRDSNPRRFEVGVSTRSPIAFFLVPFMCVWSGFSLGGIYGHQIWSRHFDWQQSLFGIPFILGTLLFGSFAVMSVCGKIVVTIDGDEGVVFTGVGPIGSRKRFNWRNVSGIRRTERYGKRGAVTQQITLDGEKQLTFGSGVSDDRFHFLLSTLHRKWRESGYNSRF